MVVQGERFGLIDWEQLRAGRRIEDVAQLCWAFADLELDRDVEAVGRRWRRVLDVYGLVDRTEVTSVARAKIDQCIDAILRLAALGSARHQRLRDRGDPTDLGRMRHWLTSNQAHLDNAIN